MGTKPDEDRSPVAVLDKIRANPTGRLTLKIAIALLGALVLALGLILIPFPGPGWAIVILGLAIWAIEFTWAKKVLDYTKRQVRSWTTWVGGRTSAIRAALGLLSLISVGAVLWASAKLSLGVDLIADGREWLTSRRP